MSQTSTRTGIRYPRVLQEALAWLAEPPAHDPLRDLAPMRRHLAAIAILGIPPLQYVKILELFQARVELTGSTVTPLLLDATLPVAANLRVFAQGLMAIYEGLAAGCLQALQEGEAGQLRSQGYAPARLCAMGLANLAQQYEVALLISAPAPPGLWLTAQALRHLAQTDTDTDAMAAAERHMKAMLALATAQPEGLLPRETSFLAAYLRQQAGGVDIEATGAANHANADYWLAATTDAPPTARVRRPPPHDVGMHFSCTELARVAREQLSRLAAGASPESLGLPPAAALTDYRDVLARAAQRWATPPQRATHRRRHGYRVQVCAHIGPLWQQLSNANSASAAEFDLPASDWMIINESPSGYAIMHVAGALVGLVAGAAIGLRAAPGKPWHICIVRWARSDNPEHLELGLELVAPQAAAVRIAQRSGTGEAAPLPALLLPPLPALQRGEALLTARGSFTPGRFALIDEAQGRIRIAECAAAQLSLHTPCIEIFEFDRRTGVD